MRIFVGNSIHPGTTGLHIQARPQGWVADLDSVPILRPTEAMVPLVMRLVQERKEGRPIDMRIVGDYHALYDARLRRADLSPGHVRTASGKVIGEDQTYTLICTCSRSEAMAGRCHRVYAAWWLDRFGWEVYCDWIDNQQKLLGM